MQDLTVGMALAQARAATGLDDFGGETFLEGLERTLAAFGALPLKSEVRREVEAEAVRNLSTRLRIEDWRRRHPELEREVIEGPLVVTGLPRTGTTATVSFLALDPRFRFLRAWEGRSPVPPPELGAERHDPRAVQAREAAKSFAFANMHLNDPDGSEEDIYLLAPLEFRAYHGRLPVPDDYLDWWIRDDFGSTFAYHRRVLQILQSRRPPNRWLLKAPLHLFKLEALVTQYPDAKIVMTHRDPARIVSSVASLSQSLHDAACGPGVVDPVWTGARSASFWSEGMRRALAARDRLGEHRFVDIDNRDVVSDPVAALGRLYEALGLSTTPDLVERWRTYHRDNAKGAYGEHTHRLEDFGLETKGVRAMFADYVDRFGV